MGRNRKVRADEWMPPGVRLSKGRYIIRNRHTQGRERRLCSGNVTKAQVWAAYDAACSQGIKTLDDICKMYLNSDRFKSLSESTYDLYHQCHRNLLAVTYNDGVQFLDIPPNKITSGVLRRLLDIRAKQDAPVMGNREVKGFLGAVFTWALERDLIPGMTNNPCHGVKRNQEKPRSHYVDDRDYELALKHAHPIWLAHAMELAYLLYARIGEVLKLTRADILDEGIIVHRLKGSKNNIVKWSPRLLDIIDKTKSGSVRSHYLVHDAAGQRITYSRLRKPWDRMMTAARNEHPDFVPFTRHDLKAKGISDQMLMQNSAGHRSPEIAEQYKRRMESVLPAK